MEPLRMHDGERHRFVLITHPTEYRRVLAYIHDRPAETHRYQIVTPHGTRLMTAEAFRRTLSRRIQRLSVAPKWYSAMDGAGNVYEKKQVLRHLTHRLPGYTLADEPVITDATDKALA